MVIGESESVSLGEEKSSQLLKLSICVCINPLVSSGINGVSFGFDGFSLFFGEMDLVGDCMNMVSESTKKTELLKFTKADDWGSVSDDVSNVGGGGSAGVWVEKSRGVEVTNVGVEVDEVRVGAHFKKF